MKAPFALNLLLIAALLGSGLFALSQPTAAAASPAGGIFGYTLHTEANFAEQWKEIHLTGSPINFGVRPDDVITPVNNFGFNFPFFENEYSSVFVSTNGFLTFNTLENAYPTNYTLPMEFEPNNLIAVFWDDLTVGGSFNSGQAYYQLLGTSPNRAMVFEWYQITRLGSTEPLTFQIVLHENGDIFLNYATLSGVLNRATVGIENSDGVDGFQIFSDEAGLASGQSYHLVYPENGANVKARPLYQGGFLSQGSIEFPLTITNTGATADTFTFQSSVTGSPAALVEILNDLKTPITQTPSLAPSAAFSASIRVTVDPTAAVGSKWSGTVTVISNANNTRQFAVKFDAAMPARMAALFLDKPAAATQPGAYARYFSKDPQGAPVVFPSFQGENYAITPLPGLKYLLSWEEIADGPAGPYKNIKKTLISPAAGLVSATANLTDNAASGAITYDETAQITVAPNGTLGMVFVRWVANATADKFKANIYFAHLSSTGSLLAPVIDLTQNSTYTTDLRYTNPVIAATPSSAFEIAYEALTLTNDIKVAHDIELLVLSNTGTILQPLHHLTDSLGTGKDYFSPAAATLQNGSVLLAFLSSQTGQANQVHAMLYQPLDNSAGGIQVVGSAAGEGPRLDTLSNGKVVLAWVASNLLEVEYTLFNPLGAPIGGSPAVLASPNGWKIEKMSLTHTLDGHAALTWKDEWGIHLYYALIAESGSPLTAPMIFLRGSDESSPQINLSLSGKGIAPYSPFQAIYIPQAKR